MNLLFVSTPIGFLGSGKGGGIEQTIINVSLEMRRRGHRVVVLAPSGSQISGGEIEVIEVSGNPQVSIQTQSVDADIVLPKNSVLANLWEKARQIQREFDVVINFAYDWLPLYLTFFFETPVAHHVSMSFLSTSMDDILAKVCAQNPLRLKFDSRAQADTYSFEVSGCPVVHHGVPLADYTFAPQPRRSLLWLGRIAPEKALEDAVRVAQATSIELRIFGTIENAEYWAAIQRDFPDAPISYGGYIADKQQLQGIIGESLALLMTPRWVEAFGIVVIESLACGTPVITYGRGGPAEIIRDGETGFVVEPDNVAALVAAVGKIEQIDRRHCRHIAETEFSLEIMGDRLEAWFKQLIA